MHATIAAMVKPHMTGPATRRAILDELRRREDAGEPVSVSLLATALGMPRGTVAPQLARLRRVGLVQTKLGRAGYIRLTDAGRIATD